MVKGLSRRDIGIIGGLGLLAASRPALAAGAAPATPIDPARFVNPEFKPWFPILKATATQPAPTRETLATGRGGKNPMLPPPAATPAWEERKIPGPKGAPDVTAYVINAGRKGAPRPAILHTHGGGFVFGTAKDFISILQELASELDCVVVTVDYRLAPETPFPGSLEDNYAGLKWLHAHAEELGADPKRIAVMGESAGGGHAAMLAIAARDRGEVPVIYQSLIYPMLDDRTGSTRTPAPQVGAYIWRPVDNRFGWTSLLGKPAGSAEVPYGAVPARVENLKGLPPTFIGVGSIDLFVDESMEYARRLTAASVPVELHVYPGCFHAFDILPTPTAKAFRAAARKGLKDAFAQAA